VDGIDEPLTTSDDEAEAKLDPVLALRLHSGPTQLDRTTKAEGLAGMTRSLLTGFLLAVLLVGCGGGGGSSSSAFGDVQRVWCGAHPDAAVNAGVNLGIPPSRFVTHKAAVEQASLDGDAQRVQGLVLDWVGQEITATDSDPHRDLKSMPSWEADAASDFQRACLAAYGAR
jgi:hypothetical protein